jgi:hypothetical protein
MVTKKSAARRASRPAPKGLAKSKTNRQVRARKTTARKKATTTT